MTPQQRLTATFEVTDMALRMMRDSIRVRHPEADEAEIVRLGRERIAKVRRIDEVGRYKTVERPQ